MAAARYRTPRRNRRSRSAPWTALRGRMRWTGRQSWDSKGAWTARNSVAALRWAPPAVRCGGAPTETRFPYRLLVQATRIILLPQAVARWFGRPMPRSICSVQVRSN